MRKVVGRTGNSMGIYFTKEELTAYGLKKGSIIEIELNIVGYTRRPKRMLKKQKGGKKR